MQKPEAEGLESNPEADAPPRAPSPPSSHVSVEEEDSSSAPQQDKPDVSASEAPGDGWLHVEQQGGKSAFGDRAKRAFSDKLSDASTADITRKTSASSGSYTGLNPTGTRSASRLFSGGMSAETAPKKEAPPMTKRDMVANSILQMQMDMELDTFTADIDCLYDSDDEEEEQPAAIGRREEPTKQSKENKQQEKPPQGKPKSESNQQPAPKRKRKQGEDADQNSDDEDNEDVDHAFEDLSSDDSHDKLQRVSHCWILQGKPFTCV